MRKIEKEAATRYSLSSELLMETAGLLAAREVETVFLPEIKQGPIGIVCGTGHNGADGLVVARHLRSRGHQTLQAFIIGKPQEGSRLFKKQLERAKRAGVSLNFVVDRKSLEQKLRNFTLYIDALFGTGLNRNLTGFLKDTVVFLNTVHAPLVSLDIPSGLSADTGEIMGAAVQAAMTLSFGLAKPGLFTINGARFSGQIRVIPLGLPRELLQKHATTYFLIDQKFARRFLPTRENKSNKFSGGRLFVLAGKPGSWGAAAMCTQGAYRIGSGYVTLVAETAAVAKLYLADTVGPEVLVSSLDNKDLLSQASAVIVGPGSGTSSQVKNFILKLSKEKFKAVVLDADALTCLTELSPLKIPESWILTPHSGELSRLLKVSSGVIDENRFHYAALAAKTFGCQVLLKGFHSVLAEPGGTISIINSGNASLAKAGTGDILSGFIGGLLGQGLKPGPAAGVAAYLHGLIADDWVREGNDPLTFVATDLLARVGALVSQVHRE